MAIDPQTFFGVPWRTVVTDLDSSILTFLDRLASNRTVKFALNAPSVASGQVPSGNPEVNILAALDDEPFVSYSDRLLYMFRREGVSGTSSPGPWVCRFGGILMQLQDQAASDNATTTYTAYDPWQLLYRRPVVQVGGGNGLPTPDGVTFKNTTADIVVTTLLGDMAYAESLLGSPHPEAFIDYGQTVYYTGVQETGHVVEWINFDQTSSIGEAFDQITQQGLCDIWLEPIYDPVNRPGIVAQLNIYQLQGTARNNAIMAWDKPSRSLSESDALYDGTVLLNRAKFFASQGPALNITSDAISVAKYGSYWEPTMFSGVNSLLGVSLLSAAEVNLRRYGKTTYKITPIAGRSPIPFVEYGIGDQLPVYASDKMRAAISPTYNSGVWAQMTRVYGIDVNLDNNDVESVDLTLSRDGGF